MGDSIKLALAFMTQGIKDSIKGIGKVFTLDKNLAEDAEKEKKTSTEPMSTLARRRAEKLGTRQQKHANEPKVMHRILLCCAWNGGLFLLSILLFYGVVLPTLKFFTNLIFGGSSSHPAIWWWMSPLLSWTFNALWILPLFVLSKVVNSLWFQDIADAAYRKSRGRPQMLPSLSKIIADILFSLLLQALFLIQGMLASLLPIGGLGNIVYMLHISLLYSLYAFEYKWFNMGWEVQKRLSYIENNWPYFVGFGLPLSLFTSLSSSHVINGCLFSIAFPLFIISSNEAKPLQVTYDTPIKFFSIVVSMSNTVFRQSVKTTQTKLTSSDRSSRSPTPTKRVTLPDKQSKQH